MEMGAWRRVCDRTRSLNLTRALGLGRRNLPRNETANESDHLGVVHLLGQLPQEPTVSDVVEEAHDVELGHPAVTSVDRFSHPPCRTLGTAPGAIAEAARQEQRLDHRSGGLLDHPVGDGGDPERAGSPATSRTGSLATSRAP
ncbi:MAG TPA: hypothetical protein VNG12_14265 [Acidimicrobiales bacterium]|nr:hypothetical protein [Acidimicrobiales bacterium]